ncbi:MAG TPA: uracil-DNA glycosylase, partial [bacterium (Candidatus Stahlbacteria)]|nr:uracil-DNA glycosylase [Candidatus Stahlbacteria bacterium]
RNPLMSLFSKNQLVTHPNSLLLALYNEAKSCKRCTLYKTRKNFVFGEGNPCADIVFIGEAPGREEDLVGRPFVGEAGKLLTKMIEAINLKREEVYIGNILKCRPPGNRDPLSSEIEACKPWLYKQLKIIKPKIICTLGKHATLTLLNKANFSELRGKVHDFQGAKLLPTYHPAALLYNPRLKQVAWKDMKLLQILYSEVCNDY